MLKGGYINVLRLLMSNVTDTFLLVSFNNKLPNILTVAVHFVFKHNYKPVIFH